MGLYDAKLSEMIQNSATCCDGCDMLEDMVSIRYDSQLNNPLHFRFDDISPLFLKIILSLQFAIFGYKWKYDDFALE